VIYLDWSHCTITVVGSVSLLMLSVSLSVEVITKMQPAGWTQLGNVIGWHALGLWLGLGLSTSYVFQGLHVGRLHDGRPLQFSANRLSSMLLAYRTARANEWMFYFDSHAPTQTHWQPANSDEWTVIWTRHWLMTSWWRHQCLFIKSLVGNVSSVVSHTPAL